MCPRVSTVDTMAATCDHNAGDDSSNPTGANCSVADLCAPGWRVCENAAEVVESSPTGCVGATQPGDAPLFFASRQSSNGCGICATGTSTAPTCNSRACAAGCLQTDRTSNDLFGCGNFGAAASDISCNPLDRTSGDQCSGLAGSPWECADNCTGLCESYVVTKAEASHGGVLCCRDFSQDVDGDGVASNEDCDDDDSAIGAMLYENDFSTDDGWFSPSASLTGTWRWDGAVASVEYGGQQALIGMSQNWSDIVVYATVSARGTESNCGNAEGQMPCDGGERWRAGIVARAALDADQDEGYHGYRCALASNARNGCFEEGLFLQLAEFMDAEEDDVASECNADCPMNTTFDQHGRQNHSLIDLSSEDVGYLTFYAVGSDLYCQAENDAGEIVSVAGQDDSFTNGTIGLSTLNIYGEFGHLRVCEAFSAP